jgi:hypothetical protein
MPDLELVGDLLSDWNCCKVRVMGVVLSHPLGCEELSDGDLVW